MSQLIDFKKAIRSFRYAGRGIIDLFRFENNARIHLSVAVVVLAAGFYFQLTPTEWALIFTQIGLVWAAEAFNTAIEKIADVVSPDFHPTIKSVKDLAAGGVLIVAICAVSVGLLVFLPRLVALF